jgi:hypothetical protein
MRSPEEVCARLVAIQATLSRKLGDLTRHDEVRAQLELRELVPEIIAILECIETVEPTEEEE